jgi:SAM-dependent methyltransferase
MNLDPASQDFFEEMYRHSSDPWNFASSPYELSRYNAIMHALNTKHYRHAFEPGCSVGVLTERLAPLCDRVDAMDISPTAVTIATERCTRFRHVEIDCKSLDDSFSVENIDLLVLSEIGYYFNRDRWRSLVEHLLKSVAPSGTILAVHWLGQSKDHRQHGDSVHEVLRSVNSMSLEYSERNMSFRLDRWRKL